MILCIFTKYLFLHFSTKKKLLFNYEYLLEVINDFFSIFPQLKCSNIVLLFNILFENFSVLYFGKVVVNKENESNPEYFNYGPNNTMKIYYAVIISKLAIQDCGTSILPTY